MSAKDNAALFHRLHADGLLLLANCWDAGSARLIERQGAKALATTSAGVAWAHGYADGDVLPIERLVSTVSAITRNAKVPLTVDFEGGYSDDPAVVARNIAPLLDAGAVGINIEDGRGDPDLLCRKIAAVKEVAIRAGIDLFVNARSDVYLKGLVPEAARVDEMLRRGRLYAGAGASGLFAAGMSKPDEIRTVAEGVALPLNVLAWGGLPNATELQKLGVRRLSAGSAISEAIYGRTASLAAAFFQSGSWDGLGEGALSYGELNSL